MAAIRRKLTFHFRRSVAADGRPTEMEVVVLALNEPSSSVDNATYVGGPQQQVILLGDEDNLAVFELVPSDDPSLEARIAYRVEWREKYYGAIESHDFYMPDRDCDFDDLGDLGQMVDTATYLRESDLGVVGRVARLNEQGQVVDAFGDPVGGTEEAAAVQGNLDAEVVARQQADSQLRTYLLAYANEQVAALNNVINNKIVTLQSQLVNADTIERAQRQQADTAINTALTELEAEVNAALATLVEDTADLAVQLAGKVPVGPGGKIPTEYLPSVTIGHAVVVADQAEMLGLTTSDVQTGDMAVRPDGTWVLNGNDPAQLGNWVQLTSAGTVTSVNSMTGTVVLNAASVGARAAGVALAISDTNGLQAALDGKAPGSSVTSLTSRVTAVENDPTIVKTAGGEIPRAQHSSSLAYLNGAQKVTDKAGNVINLATGGALGIADVQGLAPALAAKADVGAPATPTAHAASHAAGGSDPVTPAQIGARPSASPVPQADVEGLPTALTGQGNRITALENTVASLSPGPSGITAKAEWWDAPAPTTSLNGIILKSPFGKAASDGHLYYDPAGAADGEWVYAHITPNGHLELRQRNEAAAPDPVMATQAGLDATNIAVALKANQSSLDSTNTAVAAKASQGALDSTDAAVAGKAAQTDLLALQGVVAAKAPQTQVDALVNGKADKTALAATDALVAQKAPTTAVTALDGRLTAAETSLANKAELAGGTVPLNQIPTNIPTASIVGLDTALTGKADSSAVTTVAGRVTAIENDATIVKTVGGYIPTSVIPQAALTRATPVANRAEMLSLPNVQQGDIAVITATADKGTYMLGAGSSTDYASWVRFTSPDDVVSSVNGQTGTVVLDAVSVGARSSGTPIPQADVTNLPAALTSKADKAYVDTQLVGKTSLPDVDTRISTSSNNKLPVALVATANVLTLSGQQQLDATPLAGTLAAVGQVVLLTAQANSVQNGLWVVSASAWTRAADMPDAGLFLRGTLVSVSGGNNNAGTLWQQTNTTGTVGTSANNWSRIGWVAQPIAYTGSLGVERVGNDFRVKPAGGGGLMITAGGVSVDPAQVPRKFSIDVPSGSATPSINHGLNTNDFAWSVHERASGIEVLVGGQRTGPNTISLEFASPPASGQYRFSAIG